MTIPKSSGASFNVSKGQVLRVIEVEGPQAADLMVLNTHDYQESYSAWFTRQRSRSFTRAEKIYSKLPAGNVMFTVLNYREGIFWLTPGRCNSYLYSQQYGISGYHKSCHDILKDCLKEYGIEEWNLPDVLNLFMKAVFTSDGTYSFEPSPVVQGDSIDLRAEMDCLVAVSACPDDIGPYNGKGPKPLKIQIRDGE
jgi:uncharacterized protein